VKFYNVKTRESVEVPEANLARQVVKRTNGQESYAVTAEVNGTRLFKFVSKKDFDAMKAPQLPTKGA